MTDAQYVQNEQRKIDAELASELTSIQAGRDVGQGVIALLLLNDLITFGGPSDTNKYNHFRLTDAGTAELARIEGATVTV